MNFDIEVYYALRNMLRVRIMYESKYYFILTLLIHSY